MRTNWLGHIGRAVGTAAIWGVMWGVAGVAIGIISASLPGDPLGWVLDPWIAMAMPGFIAGVVYSVVLVIAERGRRIREVPLRRIVAWGAVAGLLLGVFPFVAGTPTDRLPLLQLAVTVIGSTIVMSALSAVGSALLFRVARRQPPAGGDVGGRHSPPNAPRSVTTTA